VGRSALRWVRTCSETCNELRTRSGDFFELRPRITSELPTTRELSRAAHRPSVISLSSSNSDSAARKSEAAFRLYPASSFMSH
jgi:hypothetical protein